MSQGLVSVVMGTYDPDCGKLKKSVESIIAQTYENWELLLYDDGSKKEKAEKIWMISRMDPRIKYIRNNRNKGLAYALNILPKFQGKTLKRILNVSVWTMIQNFVSLSTWFMFFLFVEHLGERSLAIANIIRNVSGIPFMIAMAFASTCGSLVSNLIGAGEQDCVRGTIRQHIRIGYIFVLPILIFFCLFPDLILRIYTDMPDLRAASVPSLWVLCSAYLVLVPANVYFQSVSGTGNTRTALAMELCVLAIYVTYSAYFIMYLRMDVAFAWTTECVYGIFTLMFCYWYMKKGNWQKKKI